MVVRYQPLSLFSELQRDMNKLLESRFGDLAGEEDASRVVTSHWSPAVDIKEEEQRFLIHADLPGVDVKDIDITMEQGVLTLRGDRDAENVSEEDGYRRVERVRGTFYRRFSLPDSADPDGISARSSNGVLEIEIPKRASDKPRKITVNR